ncbi:band 4.1-like protein 4A [Meleagris gallopavo]|uniref:band 4.1-like protein 4A n=1 Tax=Meleagris gallopavo TaxID=9103 RepID=UPI00093EEC4C|nr:band 4.1-like protein 4A [Meleagris gallopavo]
MGCFCAVPEEFYCEVLFLDESKLTLTTQQQGIKKSTKGSVVLGYVFRHLNLVEIDYFGLRYCDRNHQTVSKRQAKWDFPLRQENDMVDSAPQWEAVLRRQKEKSQADPSYRRSRHRSRSGLYNSPSDRNKSPKFPYSRRRNPSGGSENECGQPVRRRYQFFLQVKQDILQGRLPCPANTAAQLGAYVIQSELGDYDPYKHTAGYVSEYRFVPDQKEELEDAIERIHKTLMGQVPAEAEANYLEVAKSLEMYGVDLHPVYGENKSEYFLGLTPIGVVVYKNKKQVGKYFWPRITKVHFKETQFELRVLGKDVSFYLKLRSPDVQAKEELWKHIQKELVDPSGLSEEQLKEIPYTKIETQGDPIRIRHSHSPRSYRQYRRSQCSDGERSVLSEVNAKNDLVPPLPVTRSSDVKGPSIQFTQQRRNGSKDSLLEEKSQLSTNIDIKTTTKTIKTVQVSRFKVET